ncbi:MAG: hypothetical protein SFV23_14505 [Planctomycetaceae bacterium]|nr:hypothetical protein [Planctomycetaceae bacterium]
MLKQCLVMGLAMAITGDWAIAADPPKTVRVQKLSVLLKSKVLIQEDQPAGQVVDVVFSEGGCVDYVVVNYEQQYYAIPYSAVTMRYADQIVFVDVAPAQFRKVQFFSNTSWPDFYADTFRQQTFSTFAVKAIRADGARSTFKPEGDGKGNADTDKPKTGSAKPKADRDPASPRPKLNPGQQPNNENSVTPDRPKKSDPTAGGKADPDQKQPKDRPAAGTPLPKPPATAVPEPKAPTPAAPLPKPPAVPKKP